MYVARTGLDPAKIVFQVDGVDRRRRKVFSRQLRRNKLVNFFQQLEPTLIGLEACVSTHHWARMFGQMGPEIRLIAPHYHERALA